MLLILSAQHHSVSLLVLASPLKIQILREVVFVRCPAGPSFAVTLPFVGIGSPQVRPEA
jgi:hypothetical protein